MTDVERRELAPGLSISRVLTGLWQVADLERDGTDLDPAATAAHLEPYAAAGFTTFDMADHYGSAEVISGHFAHQHANPSSLQRLTKWVPTPGPCTAEEVREAVERAMDRLQTERIDLLQFHAWNYADPSWLDTLFHLQELQQEGLIHHLGVTNFDTAHLRIALTSGLPIVSNQVCFSLLDQRARGAMTDLCGEFGVQLLAFGTVAGGFLTERWLEVPEPDPEKLETWSQMKYFRFVREAGGWDIFQRLLRTVYTIAQRRGVSMANVACRHILDQESVAGIIVGARLGRSEHIDDNRRLFEFALTEEDRRELQSALDDLHGIPGDCGDEYRKPPFLTASGDLSHHLDDIPAPFTPRSMPSGRTLVMSGTPWEDIASYCRAVRHGDRILVSGTTATHGDRTIGVDDPAAQTHFILDKIEGALQSLGASLQDVLRTRIYVRRAEDCEPIARAHGERFRDVMPANTLVEAKLIGDDYLVEIEAEAVLRIDRREP